MTFAVSFLVRPLGGFVWGPLGDKLGRRQAIGNATEWFDYGLYATYISAAIFPGDTAEAEAAMAFFSTPGGASAGSDVAEFSSVLIGSSSGRGLSANIVERKADRSSRSAAPDPRTHSVEDETCPRKKFRRLRRFGRQQG